jgi:L-fuconolactonase
MSFEIIDSHQHFWEVGRFDYPWMSPEVDVLYRDYALADLEPLAAREGVSRTVLVQASNSLDETQWMLDIAEASDLVAGVVGWVDLTSPAVAHDLDELMKHPKLKGVRHLVESEPDDRWLERADVLGGLRELERRRLPYDLLVHTRHLDAARGVADACPGLRLVVDHLAKPPIASREFDEWALDIERIAEVEGVSCKLSGLVTEAGPDWSVDDLKPYVDHALRSFGAERLIFGSDYPVCLLAASYSDVHAAARLLVASLDEEARALVFGGNAKRFYGI